MDIAGRYHLTAKSTLPGASSFEVLRWGISLRSAAPAADARSALPRAKIEKNIKKVVEPGSAVAQQCTRTGTNL